MSRKFLGLVVAAGLAVTVGLATRSPEAEAGFRHHHGWCSCGGYAVGYCGGYCGGYAVGYCGGFCGHHHDFDDDDACGWVGCGSWCGGYAACAPYSVGYSACGGWCGGGYAGGYSAGYAPYGYAPGPAYSTFSSWSGYSPVGYGGPVYGGGFGY